MTPIRPRGRCVLDVLDDVAVRLHVEGIEKLPPRKMRLEIGDGAGRSGPARVAALHLRSYCMMDGNFRCRRIDGSVRLALVSPYGQAMKRAPLASAEAVSGLLVQCKCKLEDEFHRNGAK